MPEIHNLKQERFILAQVFKGFGPLCLGSIISGPVVGQSIMGGSTWWDEAADFMDFQCLSNSPLQGRHL